MLQSQMRVSDGERVVLRWSDAPEEPTREAPVDMLEAHLREAVISSGLKLNERTEVQLIGRGYHEAGVVRSCRAEGTRFILVIGITSAPEPEVPSFHRDPGAVSVDHFLTEEQAEQILDELDRELGSDCEDGSAQHRAVNQIRATMRLLRFSKVLAQLCAMSRVETRFCG